jgi:hypothetical protein
MTKQVSIDRMIRLMMKEGMSNTEIIPVIEGIHLFRGKDGVYAHRRAFERVRHMRNTQ